MLQHIFHNVIDMSITASVVIIVILLLRQLFKNKLPRIFIYSLWGLVVLRLLLPFSVSSTVSIFNIINVPNVQNYNYSTQNDTMEMQNNELKIIYGEQLSKAFSKEDTSQTTMSEIDKNRLVEKNDTKNIFQHSTNLNLQDKNEDFNLYSNLETYSGEKVSFLKWVKDHASFFWFVIFILLILGYAILYYKEADKFKEAVLYKNKDLVEECSKKVKLKRRITVYLSDRTPTPIVCGLIKPRVILPLGFIENSTESELQKIITHEFVHVKRFDYLLKPLFVFVMSVHWFNPFVWVSFIVSQKDMELSCDEKVLALWGINAKSEYASLLIKFATKEKRIINGLAFGESDIKNRVKGIMKFKKPRMLILIIAFLSVIVLGVILLTNGKINSTDKEGDLNYISEGVGSNENTNKDPDDNIDDNPDKNIDTNMNEIIGNEASDVEIGEDEVLNILAEIQKNAPSDIDKWGDYFKSNSDFNKLLDKGQPALDTMLNIFSKNNEDGPKEYIMAYACSILMNTSIKGKELGTSGRGWYYKVGVFRDVMQVEDADFHLFSNSDKKPKKLLPEHTNMKDINNIITNYILSIRRRSFTMGEKGIEAHKIYRVEKKNEIHTAYIMTSFSWFGFENGDFVKLSGSSMHPLKMVLKQKENGEYEIVDCEDVLYVDKEKEKAIKAAFPEDLAQLIIEGDKKTEEELDAEKINKAREYLIKIKRQDAEISLSRPELRPEYSKNKNLRSAIHRVALMKPEMPEFIGSKEVLVNVGGKFGTKVRCILETNCSEEKEGKYIVEFKKSWDFSIQGEKIQSYWKYLVEGDRVELLESVNNDKRVSMK